MKVDMLADIHNTVLKYILWYELEILEEDVGGK